jgi:hypothetical protein
LQIYDMDKLAELVGDKKDSPEFFAVPSCPFYGADRVRARQANFSIFQIRE